MNIPKDFRYKSEMADFRQAVDAAHNLMEQNKLILLFGFEEDICFQFSGLDQDLEPYGLTFEQFQDILDDEVTYLIAGKLSGRDAEFQSLVRYLKRSKISEEDGKEILDHVREKASYVGSQLLSEQAVNRYHFKESTVNPKLLDLDWDISRYIFSPQEDQLYALLRFQTAQQLPSRLISRQEAEGVSTFQLVCDREDLRAVIGRLELLAAEMEECEK